MQLAWEVGGGGADLRKVIFGQEIRDMLMSFLVSFVQNCWPIDGFPRPNCLLLSFLLLLYAVKIHYIQTGNISHYLVFVSALLISMTMFSVYIMICWLLPCCLCRWNRNQPFPDCRWDVSSHRLFTWNFAKTWWFVVRECIFKGLQKREKHRTSIYVQGHLTVQCSPDITGLIYLCR